MDKRIILFDLDHTLVNTQLLKKKIEKEIIHLCGIQVKIFEEIAEKYLATLDQSHDFSPESLVRLFSKHIGIDKFKLLNIFYKESEKYQDSLYSDVSQVLEKLAENYYLGIYSQGNLQFQEMKVYSSDIYKYISPDLIFISREKTSEKALEALPRGATIIDDNIMVINKLNAYSDSQLSAIWIDRNNSGESLPNLKINNLKDLSLTLGATLHGGRKTQDGFQLASSTYRIFSGITSSQIEQLIDFSINDQLVGRFTSDRRRFKNFEAYRSWTQKKRIIYTLVEGEKLVGIIWFGRSNNDIANNCDFTFAIRLYPPARGRGLAESFIRQAFELFFKSAEYQNSAHPGIWLETDEENSAAIKTYKKVGFRTVRQLHDSGKILMTYERNI